MTTLAVNTPRPYELGNRNSFGVAASTKIYEGAAVGIVLATGLARPLTFGDKFVGFAEATVDNSAGAAAALPVRVIESGKIQLPVAGAVITDQNQPVYATDDNAFGFTPVSGVFIGYLHRFVSAGVAIVEFDAPKIADPYAGWVHAALEVNTTIDATHTGKWLWCKTDAVVFTLPAVEGIGMVRFGNMAAYGVSGLAISPNASDMIEGPGITAADNKDLINTKATANRGDWAEINYGDSNGWSSRFAGTWAREA